MPGMHCNGFNEAMGNKVKRLEAKGLGILYHVHMVQISYQVHGHARSSVFWMGGYNEIEGVALFDTYAPVISWATVRLLLTLSSVVLGVASKQVDYMNAFVHAEGVRLHRAP